MGSQRIRHNRSDLACTHMSREYINTKTLNSKQNPIIYIYKVGLGGLSQEYMAILTFEAIVIYLIKGRKENL